MLNSILNGSSRTSSSRASRSSSGYYQGRSGSAADKAVPPSQKGVSVVEKKGDNFITVHANGNDYTIENKTAQEFNNETKSYSSAQIEEYAKSISVNQAATNTGGGMTTPPPTGDTTTPPPTDTGGGTMEEESDNTLMYILIAAIVGVALFPTGKKKKKKK